MNRAVRVACLPPLLVALDFSVLALSAPALASDLDMSPAVLSWVYTSYSLAFGSALLVAGRLADRGHARSALVAGMTLYTCAAWATAVAPSSGWVVGSRMAQGLGAALMTPSALVVLSRSTVEEDERRTALAVYGVVVSSGFVLGGLLGGLLIDLGGWRVAVGSGSVVAAAATGLAWSSVLPSPPAAEGDGRLDVGGAVLLAGMMTSFSLAVGQPVPGTSPACVAACIACAGAFVRHERRARTPLVSHAVIRAPGAGAGGLGAALVTCSGVAAVLLVSVQLQGPRGYSGAETGVIFSAFGLAAVVGGAFARRLCRSRGPRRVLSTGLVVQGTAIAAFGLDGVPLTVTVLTLGVFGLGHVVANAGVMMVALADPSSSDDGAIVGLVSTAQYLGAGMGPVLAFLAAPSHAFVLLGGVAGLGGCVIAARRRGRGPRRTPLRA